MDIQPEHIERRELIIPGKTMTWKRTNGNFTGKGRPRFITPDEMRRRQTAIGWMWRQAHPGHSRWEAEIPLAARYEFVFDRPKGHFGTGRNEGVLKERCQNLLPITKNKGDISNLIKLVEDALNEIAYKDDCQIAETHVIKRFVEGDEAPHTRVVFSMLYRDTLGELGNGETAEPEAAQMALLQAA